MVFEVIQLFITEQLGRVVHMYSYRMTYFRNSLKHILDFTIGRFTPRFDSDAELKIPGRGIFLSVGRQQLSTR